MLSTRWQKLQNETNVGYMTLMLHFANSELPERITGLLDCLNQAVEPLWVGIVAGGYAGDSPYQELDDTCPRTMGKISMDRLAVDLTPYKHAGIGRQVKLWGTQIKIDNVASSAGTIGYELMCDLAPRVPEVIHSTQ